MKCIICGLHENTHIGKAKACFQGYGTVFKPETQPTVRPPFANGPSYDLAASEKMYKDYKPHALCTVSAGFLQFLFAEIRRAKSVRCHICGKMTTNIEYAGAGVDIGVCEKCK